MADDDTALAITEADLRAAMERVRETGRKPDRYPPWMLGLSADDFRQALAAGDIASVARRLYEQAKQRAKHRAEAVQDLRTKENP